MLRRRNIPDSEKNTDDAQYEQIINDVKKDSVHCISSIYAIILIIFGVLLFDSIVIYDSILPTQLKISDEKNNPNSFIGERSQNHLKQLVSLGSKIVGSYENEVLAVDFLKREINFIIQQANRNQKIELDHQIVSGSYFLDYKPYGLVNNYENVQNIIVRVASRDNSTASLLINCHFDSVPSSPGASDDGIMCTTMLEILRIFSKQSKKPRHNIIFLFNGAEENPLQAAHGFITKHKWAKECRSVINLEAAGLAEKEIVFQTGPGNSFLIEHYTKSALRPRAQAFGEEIFHLNLIPSDTDFRLFRDFGHIPGLDIAFAKNGYIYHTKHDDFHFIKPGAYQYVGDNVLALVKSLVESDELPKASLKKKEQSVYFDYLGLFMFWYSKSTAENINLLVCLIGVLTVFGNVMRIKQGTNFDVALELFFSGAMQLLGWGVSLLFALTTAFLLDKFNVTMSWYTQPRRIFGLYFCPTLIISSLFLIFLHRYQSRGGDVNPSLKAQINVHTIRLMQVGITFLNTVFFIRTSYFFLVPTIFCTIASIIILVFKLEHTKRLWIFVLSICLVVPIVFFIYMYSILMQLFIPITGRFGSDKNPELFIGVISAIFCIFISNFFLALIPLLKKPFNVLIGLFMIFVITIGLIGFTNYGFPYDDNKDLPTKQRYWIFHSAREFHNEKGDIVKKDSGYFLLNMDRNSPNLIKDYVPETRNIVPLDQDCDTAIFCGLPIAMSRMISIHKESTWIPAPPPIFHEPTTLHLVSKTKIKNNLHRFKFEAKGPDHLGIFISPKLGFKLVDWSFIDFIPQNPYLWNGRPTYFILYGYGLMPDKPYSFYIDVENSQSSKEQNSTSFDIVLTAQYVHHDKSRTKQYQNFLNKFPSWTHVTAWMNSYHAWVF